MIDRALIDAAKLLDVLLDHSHGNVNKWIDLVEIVPDYVPPFPRDDTRPSIQVRCLVNPKEPEPGPGIATGRHLYLRTSGHAGWRNGGYFWDMYGTGFASIEYALLAAIHAPVPPTLLKPLCWGREDSNGRP